MQTWFRWGMQKAFEPIFREHSCHCDLGSHPVLDSVLIALRQHLCMGSRDGWPGLGTVSQEIYMMKMNVKRSGLP